MLLSPAYFQIFPSNCLVILLTRNVDSDSHLITSDRNNCFGLLVTCQKGLGCNITDGRKGMPWVPPSPPSMGLLFMVSQQFHTEFQIFGGSFLYPVILYYTKNYHNKSLILFKDPLQYKYQISQKSIN
jgi:hypothetical protein